MMNVGVTVSEIAVQEFALAVYRYCRFTNGSVTSWIRTPMRNSLKGGAPQSKHLSGLAADVVTETGMSSDDRHRLAARFGLKLIVEDDHDHLQIA